MESTGPARSAWCLAIPALVFLLSGAASDAEAEAVARRVISLSGAEVSFPASQVQNWVIRQLPCGAGVGPIEFQSESLHAYQFRSRPWWQIMAVVAAVGAETALLIALLVERRQRRRAEEEARHRRRELAQAARLATVGELMASISHEINQPLGAILANAETAEMLLATSTGQFDEVRQILLDIRRDDQRASEVIQRVRRLASKREAEMNPLDLNTVVDSVVRLLEHEARRHGVTMEKDLGWDIPTALGDEVELQQVIINLALNGMEAMAGMPVDRRRLIIRTGAFRDQVSVRISDAGPGIAAVDRHNLFRSFFTTKAQGLGLGLSICRSIVEAHGGTIEAAPEPSGGAAFEFKLPACAPGHAPPAIFVERTA